jgi:hypothetical protein
MPISRPSVALLVLACVLPAGAFQDQSARPTPPQSEPGALTELHRMQDALGGAKRIAAVRDFEETIRAEAWDSSGGALGEVRKRTRWIRTPKVIRLDQVGPRGTYVLYFDGAAAAGWEILPDLTSADRYKTTGKAIALEGGELEFAKGYLSGFELDLWLADRMPGFTVTSPKPNVLRIEHDGKATDFTLDPSTSLPAASAGISLADPDRPVPAEMRYDGWKDVSGVRFATRRTSFHSGIRRGEVTTEDIRVNAGLQPQELAAKPADFAPDISRR